MNNDTAPEPDFAIAQSHTAYGMHMHPLDKT